jgi:hypothetical protein
VQETLSIDPRYCGPPEVANGGYVAGLLARRIEGPASVTLLAPAPLGKPLEVRTDGSGRVALRDGDALLATAEPDRVTLEPPSAPDFDEALRRAGTCRAFQTHPFPGCFVCGPDREPGDGLRIFPGPVPGSDRVVAWPLSVEGRRSVAGVALYAASGEVAASGRATWVSLAGRR